MKLHLDSLVFKALLVNASNTYGIRADIVEKDYYVTLLLKELAMKQHSMPLKAYFKGGTALYKILGKMRRFSEDIDLTVFVEDCPTQNQARKRLEEASKKYQSLKRNLNDLSNHSCRGSITCNYVYSSIVNFDILDPLQRFGKVKIEATSFTVSEPTENVEISPILYDLVLPDQKDVLSEDYDVAPFNLNTIKIERIFIDKIYASEFYYLRRQYNDVAKHIYDIGVLLQNKYILNFLQNKEQVKNIISLKQKEENQRIGSQLGVCPIKSFSYLLDGLNDRKLEEEFTKMQDIYVFNEMDKVSIQYMHNTILEIARIFKDL